MRLLVIEAKLAYMARTSFRPDDLACRLCAA